MFKDEYTKMEIILLSTAFIVVYAICVLLHAFCKTKECVDISKVKRVYKRKGLYIIPKKRGES